MEADREVNEKITAKIHQEYGDAFIGIGHVKGTFSLQVKEDVTPYHVC